MRIFLIFVLGTLFAHASFVPLEFAYILLAWELLMQESCHISILEYTTILLVWELHMQESCHKHISILAYANISLANRPINSAYVSTCLYANIKDC